MEVSILDMQSYFEERMSKFEADLHKKSSSSTGSLAEDFAAFKSFVVQTLKSFSQQLSSVARDVDNLEMRSRRKILLLHGVTEQNDEETAAVVAGVVKQHLKIDTFTTADVNRCHRMGRQASSVKPRPILVKLQSLTLKDSIWSSKSKLKGTGVTLSEFLTKPRHKAFMAAREKFGVNKCWTRDGSVYVMGSDGNRHRIVSTCDLNKIQCSDDEKTATTIPKTTTTKPKRAAALKK